MWTESVFTCIESVYEFIKKKWNYITYVYAGCALVLYINSCVSTIFHKNGIFFLWQFNSDINYV